MAKRILFPPQLFDLGQITSQFPGPPYNFTKIFFQSELREITDDCDAIFGLICYPAWKRGNAPHENWIIGKKVSGLTIRAADPTNPKESFPVVSNNPKDPFIAFGNNELLQWQIQPEEAKQGSTKKIIDAKFLDLFLSIMKDPDRMAKSTFAFEAGISENPHVFYTVTLSDGTSSSTSSTNPCPPYEPES